MKKIYVNESSISNIISGNLLPKFLFKLVKTHSTSLGDNDAFPTSYDYPFDYTVLKERYNEVCDAINEIGLESLDEDYLTSELSSLVTRCKELEKPIRDSLEKVCENTINRLFAIPEETINFSFKLVDKIKFKQPIRMRPESNGEVAYTFKDISDIDLSNKAIGKRRFINSLIQGASYIYSNIEDLYVDDISRINEELLELYEKIRIINDYLLFIKKEKLSDDKPMQGSYVETYVGNVGEKSTIKAQGLIFPLLLHDAIRGLFEIFSVYGLPSDRKKAEYIVNKADFVLAEPWDLRLGVGLWNKIFGGIEDTNLIPYVFASFVKLPTDEFNIFTKEVLSNTEKGNALLNDLVSQAEHDNGYQEFTNRINARNIDKSIIQDSYFTGAESNGYELDSESEDGDVIEEEGTEPNSELEGILQNATIDNIDFIEGDTDDYGEKVFLSVDGIEIPSELVDLDFRVVNKKFPSGKKQLLNIDIKLDPSLRGMGLGTKIYAKAVYEFGAICSRFSTRHNDEGIRGIFRKLESLEDIYVGEDVYENIEGETINDYYAILKSQLDEYLPIHEERYTKRDVQLLTEGWSKDKRRIIDRTVNIIKSNTIGTTIYGAYKIEHDIENEYFHGSMAGDGKIRKYEPMIANILTSELGYPNNPGIKKETEFLKNALIYMWNFEIRKGIKPSAVCSFEKGVVMDDFETLVSKYKPLLDELESEGKENLIFGESDYEIIPIEDFQTAKKYGDYSNPNLKLCYTQGEYTWNRYTENGANRVFLCLNKNTWKKWGIGERPEGDEKTPYDEYGLSMIWVFINEDGNIAYSNTRWNHFMESRIPNGGYGGKDVDHSFDGTSLERTLNMPFEKAFGVKLGKGFNYTKYADEKLENINNGLSSINDEFSNEKCEINLTRFDDIKEIRIGNKYNFIKRIENSDGNKWILLYPSLWFEHTDLIEASNYPRIVSIVRSNGKHNLIDVDGNMVLPHNAWCDKIMYPRTIFTGGKNLLGVCILKINGLFNVLKSDGTLLSNEWFLGGTSNIDCFVAMKTDGTLDLFDEDTMSFHPLNEVIESYLMNGEDLPSNIAKNITKYDDSNEIYFRDYRNLFSDDGRILNKYWFKNIYKINENLSIVEFWDSFKNIIDNNTGELIIKKPINELPKSIERVFDGKFFIVVNAQYNKRNVLLPDGRMLIESNDMNNWFDDIIPLEALKDDGKTAFMVYNGEKCNVLTSDLKLLWNEPKEKWFDGISVTRDKNSFFVHSGNKFNILSFDGKLLLEKSVDYINEGSSFQTYTIGLDEHYNFIRKDDLSLVYNEPLENWFDVVSSFEGNNKLTSVKKGKYINFLNIDGNLLFDDWFIIDVTRRTNRNGNFNYTIITAENGLKNIIDKENGTLASEQWFERITELDFGNLLKCYVSANEPSNIYYDCARKELKVVNGKAAMYDFEANPIEGSVEDYIHDKFGEDCDVNVFIEGQLYRITEYLHDGNERIQNLLSLEGGKPRFLLPKWVHFVGRPLGKVAVVINDLPRMDNYYNNNRNIFNLETKSYIFPKNIKDTDVERDEGIIYVYYDNKENIVDAEGNIIFNEWADEIISAKVNGINKVRYGSKWNMYDLNNHRFLANQFYDDINFSTYGDKGETSNVCSVTSKGQNGLNKYNLLDKDGELLFDNWYDVIVLSDDSGSMCVLMNGIYLSQLDIKINFANVNTGELVSDEPFRLDSIFHIGKVKKQGKINFVDNHGHILLPQWADSASNLDNRGYVTVSYGNENRLYKASDGRLELAEQEGNASIPSDFTWCNRNQIDLIDHILRYEVIGWREGRSEHTTTYRQKVTVILKDGTNTAKSKIYTQRGDESCKWVMYEAYERLCSELGIKPAYME